MTPQEREALRRELEQHVTDTITEWLRRIFRRTVVDVEDHPLEGVSLHVRWEGPPDGALVASLSDIRDFEPLARFGVQIQVETLPDLPPITPKDAQEWRALEMNATPEWVPATFLMCLAGDRIRVSGQETDVRRSSSGIWHADNGNAWHPTPWRHTELRMDLAANPGFQQYPPDTACEILMSPERKAAHVIMQTFPGTQIVS